MKILLVLRCGGEYNEGHVQRLHRQIPMDHDLYCLTDSAMPADHFEAVTGAKKIPMQFNAWGGRGWWAKMELFRPDIAGDFLYIDLDTVIHNPTFLDELATLTTPCVLADFYFPGTSIGSGLMFLPESCRAAIWEKWIADPAGHISRNHGDQDFLTPRLWTADRFQERFPGAVVSYKAHISPEDGMQFFKPGFDDFEKIGIVCFHGNPRPWQVNHEWIPK